MKWISGQHWPPRLQERSCRKRSATKDTAVAGDTRLAPAFAGEELSQFDALFHFFCTKTVLNVL